MEPEDWQLDNLRTLAREVMQPVRDALGEPVEVLSGFRDKKLNGLVSKSKASDHTYGAAADITSPKIQSQGAEKVAGEVWELGLPVRQLIFYPKDNFIHLSINVPQKKVKKHEMLEYVGGNAYALVHRGRPA
jgi:uncharacterized protein YcbK (DUF882 family)